MKKIVLTGGGTAGHVTPNMALIPELIDNGYEVIYIGSKDGMEKDLIEDMGITYYGVSVGKLRRYFDWDNFTDPFRVVAGFGEAVKLLKKINPDVLFSKGGFVSVPVVRAAHALKIPCIIHESDMTPGLANKICIPCARNVCVNFPETISSIKGSKAVITGTPIRKNLFEGNKDKGKSLCGFDSEDNLSSRPVIMVMGGSQGAVHINDSIREILPELLKTYNVIHLCGKGNLASDLNETKGYAQFEYVGDELPDLFALADMVVSRAGANAICELLALKKPAILIPLPESQSRGDQILNANSFKEHRYSEVLIEEEMTNDLLLSKINELYKNKDKYIDVMNKSRQSDSTEKIMSLINSACKK
ncbi:MAG: undecaprenyldiphospho-muramoylpentapeptide beta-N-acetylglucosaminyltransferase [Lachnospiraceae bacterium]|nr:undecaprenyldiphospho-muramoylpentapeptide beta-N-acetylglucosaminyltransferase [Lachnospiraceae bacterium]